ncbi:MAG TPA: anthranilate phosphoribosyltransferase [Polyangiaceae bacterium]
MNSGPAISFREAFEALERNKRLDQARIQRVFQSILAGEWTPTQVAGLLVALRLAGEDSAVIAAAARALRGAMVRVDHDFETLLDTCGTGGDGHGTLNLSTGAAIIAASVGVPVAKHGNRAVSSKSGSADVLQALGISLEVPVERAADVLRSVNIAFLLAPQHHPAMRHAAVARKELGIRSIFNCLGPLANPAGATHQLLGAYDDRLRAVLAETLLALGSKRAWVVHSEDGLDELSPFGATRVTELSDGKLSERVVTPEDFGLKRSAPGAIAGGEASENAKILEHVLSGASHPSRDAFVLNAAAALVVSQRLEPKHAAQQAAEALDSGKARQKLEEWRATATEAAS